VTRSFRSRDGRYRVVTAGSVIAGMFTLSARGYPNETGGVVTGYYTSDLRSAEITSAEPPPRDSMAGPGWFERGTSGLKPLFRRLWRPASGKRKYYLGEWHSHPGGGLRPSRTDDAQMLAIASGPYHCPEPLLIVIGGRSQSGWGVSVWVYPNGRRLEMAEESDHGAGRCLVPG